MTKKLSIALVVFALFGSVATGLSKPPAADVAINTFWDKFKAAVIKGDKDAVFALSALPVTMEHSMPKIRTKAQFIKYYKHIFAGEANAAKCFKTAKPEVDSANNKLFSVGCGFAEDKTGDAGEPLVYTFKLTAAGWRFTGYDNINE